MVYENNKSLCTENRLQIIYSLEEQDNTHTHTGVQLLFHVYSLQSISIFYRSRRVVNVQRSSLTSVMPRVGLADFQKKCISRKRFFVHFHVSGWSLTPESYSYFLTLVFHIVFDFQTSCLLYTSQKNKNNKVKYKIGDLVMYNTCLLYTSRCV